MLFTALVNRLAQQLGREASTIFTSSVPTSEAATAANWVSSQTTPETLLPTEAIRVPESSPLEGELNAPNVADSSLGLPLPPLHPLEQLPIEPKSTRSSQEVPGASPQFQAYASDDLLETLDSQDWEIIEGLDDEDLDLELDDGDELEELIQLDFDSQALLPLIEEGETLSPLDIQDLDAILGIVNEKSPTSSSWSPQSLDHPHQSAELNLGNISRPEIDELYENLFGTEAPTNTTESDDSPVLRHEVPVESSVEAEVAMPKNDSLLDPESLNSLSPEVEEVLFAGLSDPGREPTPELSLDLPVGQLGDGANSWETLFFADSVADSSLKGDLNPETLASSRGNDPLSYGELGSEFEGVETITALTDLLTQMGLSYHEPRAVADSMPGTTEPEVVSQTSETDSQEGELEDQYVPASPEEDLLVQDELDSQPSREISLDQDTLQQLEEDLYQFEESQRQDAPIQSDYSSSGDDLVSPMVAIDAELENQLNQQFLMSEELLAEDWEEFVFNDLSYEDLASQRLEMEGTRELPEVVKGEEPDNEKNNNRDDGKSETD
jgi:hypothetical protein